MPLNLVLGITVWLLWRGIEAIYSHNGLARGRRYAKGVTQVPRLSVGVTRKPYFGGAFDGGQCKLIERRLSLVRSLLDQWVLS